MATRKVKPQRGSRNSLKGTSQAQPLQTERVRAQLGQSSRISSTSSNDVILEEKTVNRHDRFDWHSLYIYAICLVTILICLFSLVSFVRSIVDAVWPDPGYFDPYNIPKDSKLTSDQVKQNLSDQNQRLALKSMVNSLTTLVIAGPIYFYHWKLARKNRIS